MGIFTGYQLAKADKEAREDKQATQDLAERRMKLAENQFSAAERERALRWMSDYTEANNKRNVGAKEKAKMKAKLLTMQLDSRTADYLIGSGEAPGIIDVFDTRSKAGTISKDWIGSIVKKVDSLLDDESSPQAKALAVKTALLSAADQSDKDGQYAALLEVSFNIMESGIVPGDFNENVARAIAGLNLPEPTIALTPIGSLTSGSQAIGLDQTKKIRDEVIRGIIPELGEIFTRNSDGILTGTVDPTKIKGLVPADKIENLISGTVQDIINNLERVSSTNPSDIIEAGKMFSIKKAKELQKNAGGNVQNNLSGNVTIPKTSEEALSGAMNVVPLMSEEDQKDQDVFNFIEKFERIK